MGNIYTCSDLHFCHKNVIRYDNRPWDSVDAMNEGLISRWNSVVTDNDTVYLLGDVGFCGTNQMKALVSQLRGYKVLIRGNHDRDRSLAKWEEIGFDEAANSYVITVDDTAVHMMHEPPEPGKPFEMLPHHFYIYGHVHNDKEWPDWTPHSACVSLCRLDYTPALIQDVISGKAYRRHEG